MTNNILYFIMPVEGLPDKLVKMCGDKVIVSWRSHDENCQNVFSVNDFIVKKGALLTEISEVTYNQKYAEVFNQYAEENKR
jgi:hypothetical protein